MMITETDTLPEDVAELQEIIRTLRDEYQSYVHTLEEQIRLLKAKLFGRKSEKFVEDTSDQLRLFDEIEVSEKEPPEAKEVEVSAHSRKPGGRRPLPEDLPRIEVIHDISDEEKVCGCGSHLSRIGEEVSEKLDIVPARMQVIRYIRYKYACKSCEGIESEGAVVKTAELPPQIIPQGIATPGLLAQILTAKFVDSLPLYRQEKIYQRLGVELSRATMANWAIQVAQKCQPLIELLEGEIKSGTVINIDETTVQVMKEPGRSDKTKSYMWIFRGGDPEKPALIYQYHMTRAGDVARRFLSGYEGYVQTDGYSGYDYLESVDVIVHVGCWAHARRKFVEAIEAQPNNKRRRGSGEVALDYIGRLYEIEKRAGEWRLSEEEVYRIRQKEAKPILEEFRLWLAEREKATPPKGLMGKAIGYTLNQWNKLERYIQDGRLRPDNNLAENAIRPFVVGRKNWLFSGHPRGAGASAALYSLIETAKANKLEPYRYLRYIFEKLPYAQGENDYKNLLPQYIDQQALAATATGGVI
jgi:transposase